MWHVSEPIVRIWIDFDLYLPFGECHLDAGSQESELSQEAKKDLMNALTIRKEALEETLRLRQQELKQLCLREAVRQPFISLLTSTN